MAQIIINIPDDKRTEIEDAFASEYNRDPESPETKTQFAKRIMTEFVKGVYTSYKVKQGVDAYRETIKREADSIDIT